MTNQAYPLKCQVRAEAGITRVDVYDDIGQDSWGDGLTAKGFAGQLAAVKGPLEVHVNSSGGDVFDGLAIGEALRSHKGPVTVHVDGIAASIASVIVQAARDRVMAPGSMMMIHDAFGLPEHPDEAGLRKMADTVAKVSDNIAALYAGRAGGSSAQWRQAMRAETWYTAEEAVACGLADRVGGGSAQLPQALDLAAFAAPGRVAAALRTLPRAAAPVHAPITGTHSHEGPGGEPAREHSHDGDASHEGTYDPDHDGDDDSTAEGDTDHDYVLPNGKPGPKAALNGIPWQQVEAMRAVISDELIAHGLIPGPGGFLRPANAGKYDTEDRRRMAEQGHAMPDGSYPIADAEDLDNAIHAVGRGGADHDAIRRHIVKRAGALGLSSRIPGNWNADGSLKEAAANHLDPVLSGAAATADLFPDEWVSNIQAALKGAQQ